MRVLEVARGLGRGGAERALLSRINDRPSWVDTLLVNTAPQLDALDDPLGVPVIRRPPALSSRRLVLGAIRHYRPDVVVVRTPRDLVQLTQCRTGGLGVPLVFEAHSEAVSPVPWAATAATTVMTRANALTDLHLAVSDRVARGPQCRGARRVVTVRPGADVRIDAVPAMAPGIGPRFIVLGRLVDSKRPLWILEQVAHESARLRAAGASVLMVGAGPLEARVREAVRSLGIADLVEVVGAVASPDESLASSDVLLMGSTIEGMPLAVLEAKCMGLRIVTTPAGGVAEVLHPDDVLLPDFSETAFRSALRDQLERGPVCFEERRRRQQASVSLRAGESTTEYYAALAGVSSHRQVMEVISGPIEGGIVSALRGRVRRAPAGVATTVVAPSVASREPRADPRSIPCDVVQVPAGIAGVWALRGAIRSSRPSVILAHTERDLALAVAARSAACSMAPIDYLIHATARESRPAVAPTARLITAALRPAVRQVLAVSPAAAAGELAAGWPEVRHCPYPADLPAGSPHPSEVGHPRLLAVARLVPAKGLDRLIEGAATAQGAIRDSRAEILIVGEGPQRERLERLIRDGGLSGLVTLTGHVDDVVGLMTTAHYVLQTSLAEGAGLTVIEALAAGARVASGPVGISPSALRSDPRCTLFPAVPSADDWASWLATALTQPMPDIAEREARAARAHVDWDPDRLTSAFYVQVAGVEAMPAALG